MPHSFMYIAALSLLLGIFYFLQTLVIFPPIDSQVKFVTDKKVFITVDDTGKTIKGVPQHILSFNTLYNCEFFLV